MRNSLFFCETRRSNVFVIRVHHWSFYPVLFWRPQLHTVFQDTLHYFPSVYAKLFLVLFRRKTSKIRIRKKIKRIYTKTTKKEWNKYERIRKKAKKRLRKWRITRPKGTWKGVGEEWDQGNGDAEEEEKLIVRIMTASVFCVVFVH